MPHKIFSASGLWFRLAPRGQPQLVHLLGRPPLWPLAGPPTPLLKVRSQPLPQMHHSVSNSILYRSQWLSQRRCNLAVAHSLKVCHLKRDFLLFRQRLQSVLYGPARIRQDEAVRLSRASRRILVCFKLLSSALSALIRPHAIDRAGTSDREKPRNGLAAG